MLKIATINFKGGVGKTTLTWCLGDTVRRTRNQNCLMFDLDAQMSLTQAVTFNEDIGELEHNFSEWYEQCVKNKRTIFDALDKFTNYQKNFDFPIKPDFVYQITQNYHFVPAVEDLYWLELDIVNRDDVKEFIRRLLAKIDNSKLPKYNVVLFDCPPSFGHLSYSVLSCCDLVIIPINPDFYATKGLNLLLSSLRLRIEPHPVPKIAVVMNRAKKGGGASYKKFSNETERYLQDAREVVNYAIQEYDLKARVCNSVVWDRVGIKRAVTEGLPKDMDIPFRELWKELEEFSNG